MISELEMEFVEIFLMGKKYAVPRQLTVQKAMEYVGFQIIRGCGCRGGVCGACVMVYRTPGSYKIKTNLACIMQVQEGMMILNLPYFPSQKAIYDMESLTPSAETIMKLYPEITRCLACNTCTKICPQDVPVMEVIGAAQRGDIQNSAELSSECIMCGLCAARCPAELSPYNIALLARRLYGKYMFRPYAWVADRLRQLDAGEYDEEMDKFVTLDEETLKEEYRKAQAEKRLL